MGKVLTVESLHSKQKTRYRCSVLLTLLLLYCADEEISGCTILGTWKTLLLQGGVAGRRGEGSIFLSIIVQRTGDVQRTGGVHTHCTVQTRKVVGTPFWVIGKLCFFRGGRGGTGRGVAGRGGEGGILFVCHSSTHG